MDSLEPNPYASPVTPPEQNDPAIRISQAVWLLMVLGVLVGLMGLYNLAFWSLVRAGANPVMALQGEDGYPRAQDADMQIVIAVGMVVQGVLMLLGGWQWGYRRHRLWLGMGACAAILPPTCMCLLPPAVGVWILLLLRRKT